MDSAARERVEAKCDDLVACRLWPSDSRLRYRAWLNNFEAGTEELAAVELLDRFIFFDEEYAALAIKSAYTRYLAAAVTGAIGPSPPSSALLAQHRRVHVTIIQGEEPNPSDSGYAYARIARDRLNIDEQRIVGLSDAIALAGRNHPIILVDDFCGTGQQVYRTLARKVGDTSLFQVMETRSNVVCVTAVMTSAAHGFLRKRAPALRLFPCYVIDGSSYSVQALLPPPKHPDVYALLTKYSAQLNTPPYVHPEFGFNKLSLLFGINDNIPDGSLPIFWAPGPDGWSPLMERAT